MSKREKSAIDRACLAFAAEPSTETHLELVRALSPVVRTELRKRNLWDSPPSFLGYEHHSEWKRKEALNEIVLDFIENLYARICKYYGKTNSPLSPASLQKYGGVGGVVRLRLRQFLGELQEAHDKVGCSVFVNLRKALQILTELGEIVAQSHGSSIGNASVFAVRGASLTPPLATRDELLAAIEGSPTWRALPLVRPETAGAAPSVDALHDIVHHTKSNKAGPRIVVSILRECFAEGIQRIRVKELADALKAAVREQWGESDDSLKEMVKLAISPRDVSGDILRIRDLLDCVEQKIPPGESELLKVHAEYRKAVSDTADPRRISEREIARRLGVLHQDVNRAMKRLWVYFDECKGD